MKRLAAALEGDDDAMARLITKGFMVAGRRFALNRAEVDDDEVRYLIGRVKTVSRRIDMFSWEKLGW